MTVELSGTPIIQFICNQSQLSQLQMFGEANWRIPFNDVFVINTVVSKTLDCLAVQSRGEAACPGQLNAAITEE